MKSALRSSHAVESSIDPTDKAVILFDGFCNLCNGAVNFVIDHDPDANFKFTSLQSEEATQLLAAFALPEAYLDSLVLVEEGQCYLKSDAALRIARQLNGGWPLLYHFIWLPRFMRDRIYDWVAANRYAWFGKQDTCRIPTPALKARFL